MSGLAMFALAYWLTRNGAVSVLAGYAFAFSPFALHKAAGDSSSFVREAVAEAVRPDGQGFEVLLTLSRDEIAQVRAAAAKGLAGSRDERARKRRAELAKDPEKVVRAAAI